MKALLILIPATVFAFGPVSFHTKTVRGEKKGWWAGTANYPVFSAHSPVLDLASKTLKREAQKLIRDFLKDAPTMVYNGKPNPPFAFESTFAVSRLTTNLVSLKFSNYEDEGGAHPNTMLVTFNFGLVNGSPKKLVLKDLFDPGVDVGKELSQILMEKLRPKHLSFIDDGEVKSLSNDQLNDFVVTRKGLRYMFSAYEIASYAEGPQFVDVKFSELEGLSRSGPLKGLAF